MKGGWGNGARGLVTLVHIVWEQSHALKRGFPEKCCFQYYSLQVLTSSSCAV